MKYAFYITTSQSGGEGIVNTKTDVRTYIKMDLIRQAYRSMGIETTHPIGLGFIWRTIQSDF